MTDYAVDNHSPGQRNAHVPPRSVLADRNRATHGHIPPSMNIGSLIAPSTHSPAPNADYATTHFPFGHNSDGDLIAWQPAKIAHRRITGVTGSGKTTLARSFAAQAAKARWTVQILARHESEYHDLQDHPHVWVATSPEDHIAVIHWAVELIHQRTAGTDDTPILIAVDEFDTIRKAAGRWHGPQAEPAAGTGGPIHEGLDALLRLGHQVRIHVVAVVDRPGREDVLDNTSPIDLTNSAGRIAPSVHLTRTGHSTQRGPSDYPRYRKTDT